MQETDSESLLFLFLVSSHLVPVIALLVVTQLLVFHVIPVILGHLTRNDATCFFVLKFRNFSVLDFIILSLILNPISILRPISMSRPDSPMFMSYPNEAPHTPSIPSVPVTLAPDIPGPAPTHVVSLPPDLLNALHLLTQSQNLMSQSLLNPPVDSVQKYMKRPESVDCVKS